MVNYNSLPYLRIHTCLYLFCYSTASNKIYKSVDSFNNDIILTIFEIVRIDCQFKSLYINDESRKTFIGNVIFYENVYCLWPTIIGMNPLPALPHRLQLWRRAMRRSSKLKPYNFILMEKSSIGYRHPIIELLLINLIFQFL